MLLNDEGLRKRNQNEGSVVQTKFLLGLKFPVTMVICLSICCPLRPLETQGDSNTRTGRRAKQHRCAIQGLHSDECSILWLNPIQETFMHLTLLNLDFIKYLIPL